LEDSAVDLQSYLAIYKRRKKQLIVPFFLVVAASIATAFLLPSVYRSTATILIEEQEIPADLVRSAVTTFADQRIQSISKLVMTRKTLQRIIEEYNLYPEKRLTAPQEMLIADMRKDVTVETISASVIDPRSGRPTEATIAFTLSFDYEVPELAQKIANELTSLFLSENISKRTQAAEGTTRFLTEEASRLNKKIKGLEEKLAYFKKKNLNQLPELAQMNQQLFEQIDRELITLDGQMRSVDERKFYLGGQLAQIDPNAIGRSVDGERILSVRQRSILLKSNYASLLARYSATHPDVVRIASEMEVLQRLAGGPQVFKELENELAVLRSNLATKLRRYSNDHPDIVKLRREIISLETSIAGSREESKIASSDAENPAYITLMAQLESVKSDWKSLRKTKQDLKLKQEEIKNRLLMTPLVEQEYQVLLRDHANAVRRYQEVKAKEMEAEVSQQLEVERKGERFSLLEPPQLPQKSVKPKRKAIVFLGVLFAIAASIGLAAVREVLDKSIYYNKKMERIAGQPILAVLPYLESYEDVVQLQATRRFQALGIVLALLTATLFIHYTVVPFDVLWYKGMNKLGDSQLTTIGG